ncbi:hypothetical protein HHI36_005740 [Cryptolaemus montrouzieri]|uniref:Uncharacterized protein n=1 Tax=Cryptolaemus montrouzieri TaxID=559131 RepID=A0ABD2NWK7_9CUCU
MSETQFSVEHVLADSSPTEVRRRRNRKDEGEARFIDGSYAYRVRIFRGGKVKEVSVYYKTFLALHGVTARRIQTIKKSLINTGSCKVDQRANIPKLRYHMKHIVKYCGRNLISLSYPRSNTCSSCDKFEVDEEKYFSDCILYATDEANLNDTERKLRKLQISSKLHKFSASTFYERKRQARKKAMKDESVEAILQFSFYTFNIHVLSDQRSL